MQNTIPNHYPINKGGLVGWWSYRNTGSISTLGVWKDYSGYGNNGTLGGLSTVTSSGLFTDTTNSQAIFSDSSDYPRGSNDFTVAFTLNLKTLNKARDIINQYAEAGENRGWDIYISSDNRIVFYATQTGTTMYALILEGTTQLKANTPHKVVVTRNGSDWRIYIDGVLDGDDWGVYIGGSLDPGWGDNFDIYNSTAPLSVGSVIASSVFLNGYVDDIQIYNRGCSSGEVLFNNIRDIRV